MFARRLFVRNHKNCILHVHYIVIVTPVWPACTEIGRRSLLSCSYLYCKCSLPGHNKNYNNVRVRQRYLFLSQSLNTNYNKIFVQNNSLEEHALRFIGSPGGESQSFSVPTEGRVSPIKLLHKRNIHLVLYIYHRLFLFMTFKRYFILKKLQAIMFLFNIAENYTYSI